MKRATERGPTRPTSGSSTVEFGRDMEALAEGIHEMVRTDDHVRARVGQVEYLGNKLINAEIPVVVPIGGHGVFLDARSILAHVPQERFPAQALAAAFTSTLGYVRWSEESSRPVATPGRARTTSPSWN